MTSHNQNVFYPKVSRKTAAKSNISKTNNLCGNQLKLYCVFTVILPQSKKLDGVGPADNRPSTN